VDDLAARVLVLTVAAKATERISPRAPGSISQTAGYFIVSLEPRLPSTHSIVAFL
jgi:hypothetical protein